MSIQVPSSLSVVEISIKVTRIGKKACREREDRDKQQEYYYMFFIYSKN